MKKNAVLFLTLAAFPLLADEHPAAIKATPLVAVKKSNPLYTAVCHAAAASCAEQTVIWKAKGASDLFYLSGPQLTLVTVKKGPEGYQKQGQWDFSNVKTDRHNADDELTFDGVVIYPALYPLSKTRQAVALVSKWSTAYSGGGRSEERADFVMLNSDGSYTTAFTDIPFSASEMVRACFSEEEYARKSHCHDESWSILNLKFSDQGQAFYAWTFITKSSDWPSFTDKSAITVETTEKVMQPFQDNAR